MAAEEAREVLLHLFERKKVVSLEDMLKALKQSRMTVLRRLSEIGYLASCSHAGSYYTIMTIPKFDSNGLWRNLGVIFSQDGTLKQTVKRIVEASDDGRFHSELQEILELRVHQTLADLVGERLLGRQVFSGEFLYVSVKKGRAKEQINRRSQDVAAKAARVCPPNVIIEIFLDVIHSAKIMGVDPLAIAGRLLARGITITTDAVSQVLQDYGVVKKKERFRSKRSHS